VHVELPVLWLLVGLAAAAAVVAWANVRLRTSRLAIVAATMVFGSSLVFAAFLPALFQRFFVKPGELQLETPYIQRNITLTREAYNLRQITVKPFPAEQGLSFQSLQDNRGTIDNIRLWDWQPLMDTYAQLQEIRTYYKFFDVDVDRYQIDGSFQIEARINQNTEISQQISLWNQMGSRVIRGNLLVVPIENSILYVSPLYLRAESGQLPELKRVIAAYGDRVVMEETLPAALAALFKESVPAGPLQVRAGTSSSGPTDQRAHEALGHYDRAIDRLKVGDWSGFGTELDALRPLLEELSRQPAAR
jgi:uncharacterized membrane protein (UPF0182 family)